MLYRVLLLTTFFFCFDWKTVLAKNVVYVCTEPLATVEMQTISPSVLYRLPFLAPSRMILAGAHRRRVHHHSVCCSCSRARIPFFLGYPFALFKHWALHIDTIYILEIKSHFMLHSLFILSVTGL